MIARSDATEFWPSSPAVMLSPNDMNDVVDSLGGVSTVIMKEQLSVRWSASVTVHVTVFCPMLNAVPVAGVQVVATGASPLTTAGALNVTNVGPPSMDCAVWEAGHVIFGGSGMTGAGLGTVVGVVGPPHAAGIIAPASARARKSRHLHTKPH
jgi:hypothetical protein